MYFSIIPNNYKIHTYLSLLSGLCCKVCTQKGTRQLALCAKNSRASLDLISGSGCVCTSTMDTEGMQNKTEDYRIRAVRSPGFYFPSRVFGWACNQIYHTWASNQTSRYCKMFFQILCKIYVIWHTYATY